MDEHETPKKRCTGPCGQEYPATTEYWYKHPRGKYGMKAVCKACIKAYDNQPEVKARRKAYLDEYKGRPEYKEKQRAYLEDYYSRPGIQEHTEARRKAYRQQPDIQERERIHKKEYHNRPEVKERRRAYYSRPEIRERERAYHKDYYVETQEHRQSYYKAYYSRPGVQEQYRVYSLRRHARKKAVKGTYSPQQIQDQLKRQKHKCYYAACDHAKFRKVKDRYVYHIEHTYPISRVAGTDVPANSIDYLVLTCPTCNLSKGDKFPWEWVDGGRLL